MPLLPRKNTLDYNPDATINASKKLSVIALENLKNPLEDPDQATLSTIRKSQSIGNAFNKLEDLAGTFHSVLLRLQNLEAKRFGGGFHDGHSSVDKYFKPPKGLRRGGKMKGGVDLTKEELDAFYGTSSASSSATPSTRSRSSRSSESANSRIYPGTSYSSSEPSFGDYLSRVSADRSRFSGFYTDDDRNSFATPSSWGQGEVDDDDRSGVPNGRHWGRTPATDPRGRHWGRTPDYEDFDYSDFSSSDFSDYSQPSSAQATAGYDQKQRDWTSMIFYLIQILRRMDILVNSEIKPSIPSLSSIQIQRLSEIYKMVFTSYDDLVSPLRRRIRAVNPQKQGREMNRDPITGVIRNVYPNAYDEQGIDANIIEENEYGDEILNTFNAERNKLLLDLTVVINSWRQNTPTGQQTQMSEQLERDFGNTTYNNRQLYQDIHSTDVDSLGSMVGSEGTIGSGRRRGRPRKTGAMTMVGCGRNFYGDKINDSSDIPTIWSSVRNCPTKYLL